MSSALSFFLGSGLSSLRVGSSLAPVKGSHVLSPVLLVPFTCLPKGLYPLYCTVLEYFCSCNRKPCPQPCPPRSPHTPPQGTILYTVQYLSAFAPVTESQPWSCPPRSPHTPPQGTILCTVHVLEYFSSCNRKPCPQPCPPFLGSVLCDRKPCRQPWPCPPLRLSYLSSTLFSFFPVLLSPRDHPPVEEILDPAIGRHVLSPVRFAPPTSLLKGLSSVGTLRYLSSFCS
jgi:hypothetical protein